jgi:nucleotide-binding universal stress UspA family protein
MFPPRRVLAATDFSEPSRDAVVMAARLAVQCHAQLHVLFAEDPLLCAAARVRGVNLGQQARDELDTFIAHSHLPTGLFVHPHVVGGDAVAVICDIAHRECADVIVLGTHGMSGAARLVFGSVAEAVLRQSTIPVLLVPDGWKAPSAPAPDLTGVGPVIVGVDFTAGSLEAIAAGSQLARILHTSLELLHVVPSQTVIARWKPHADQVVDQRTAFARGELLRLARSLGDDIKVETTLCAGVVADAIATAARAGDGRHPLLVLGRRLAHSRGDAPGAIAYRAAFLSQVPTLMFIQQDSER